MVKMRNFIVFFKKNDALIYNMKPVTRVKDVGTVATEEVKGTKRTSLCERLIDRSGRQIVQPLTNLEIQN